MKMARSQHNKPGTLLFGGDGWVGGEGGEFSGECWEGNRKKGK